MTRQRRSHPPPRRDVGTGDRTYAAVADAPSVLPRHLLSMSRTEETMERLLTTREVAEITRLAPETLRYWRWKGFGPKSFRLGSRVVYRESDVIAWIEDQARV